MGISRRNFIETTTAASALFALPAGVACASVSVGSSVGLQFESDFQLLSNRSRRAVQFAIREAQRSEHDCVGSEHLLIGLAAEAEEAGLDWAENLGTSAEDFRCVAACLIGQSPLNSQLSDDASDSRGVFSVNFVACLGEAVAEADVMGYEEVHPEHLLIGMLGVEGATASWMLHEMWIERSAIHQEALASLTTWGDAHIA